MSRRAALVALALGAAACGAGASPTRPSALGAIPEHAIVLCGGGQRSIVDPASGRLVRQEVVLVPQAAAFRPTVRSESAASRLGPTAPPPTDCGTWSYDGSLTHVAGSSQGRLATFSLADGTVTPVTPPPTPGADSPVCCAAYDPASEALWYLRAGAGSTPRAPSFVAVGPGGDVPGTFYGGVAALTFPVGSSVPVVGSATPVVTADDRVEVAWQPLPSSPTGPVPPVLPAASLDYGLTGSLARWSRTVGVFRRADDGSGVAFTSSSGHDCDLFTVSVTGGVPHRVGTLPYVPTTDGSVGCGLEVVRYRP